MVRSAVFTRALIGFRFVALSALVVSSTAFTAHAQLVQQQVAGVAIDPAGMLKHQEISPDVAAKRQSEMQVVPGDLNEKVGLRKVSLRKLEAAIIDSHTNHTPLPDEIKYLAGLQRIEYVFVYPEQQDIVIAGPAEGWKINKQGEVVGVTTGLPVMLLDDLLVALRTSENARLQGISCSIDPTAEGLLRVQALAKKLKQMDPTVAATVEQTLGNQNITTTGVPGDSHFARVIVAADYKMKRYAMNFDKAPIRGMPSYLDMIGGGNGKGMNNMLPRWWLAPNYDSLLVDAEGLAWQFRGASVKCVAEEDFMTGTGERQRTNKVSPAIKKWADTMTAKYDELSAKDVIFGQLRNCIDLAVVAALISKENLPEKAGYQFNILLDNAKLPAAEYNTPKQVASIASVMQKGSRWIISASGGVQIESWALADKPETADTLSPIRGQAAPNGEMWWWN